MTEGLSLSHTVQYRRGDVTEGMSLNHSHSTIEAKQVLVTS